MAGRKPNHPVPVSDLVTELLDPVLRRRAGISVALVQSWEEIVGPRLAAMSRPLKIQWPSRPGDDGAFEPGTLVVACEGLAALHVQHQTSEILARLNAFLGFSAIGRVRIVQKPVASAAPPRAQAPPLPAGAAEALARRVSPIEDEALRASLERLGRSVLAEKARKR